MKIELVMQYNDAYAEMGDISSARAREYAARHGYSLHVSRTFPKDRSVYWGKVCLIYDRLQANAAEYIYWLDADSLILDLDFGLENIIYDEPNMIDTSCDAYGLCVGALGVRNSLWSKRLFAAWLFLGEMDGKVSGVPEHLDDQGPLMLLHKCFKSVRSRVHLVPQEIISNPDCKVKGKFMHLFWSRCFDKKENVRQMKEMLNDRP